MSAQTPLRTAIVGLRGMGLGHARTVLELPEYQLVAGCDLKEELSSQFKKEFPGTRAYADYSKMLAQERPEVVVIVTNSVTHAALTIQAAESGVRGVYCEKPMATCLADGRSMVETCQRHGVALAVNHQRRLAPVFQTLRRLMNEGAIGDIDLIRASCAGDVLSDGTHLIDTVRHLAGDAEVKWVFGQVHRTPPNPDEPRGMGYDASGGWRYGHPIETGAMAVLEFTTGLRAEIFTGSLQPKGLQYQDYQIFGKKGRFHRPSDGADPNLLIQTIDHEGWRPVEFDKGESKPGSEKAMLTSYQLFAKMVWDGAPHPLSGISGLKDLEVVMAIYESSRLRDKVILPLQQPRYPLEILIEKGDM